MLDYSPLQHYQGKAYCIIRVNRINKFTLPVVVSGCICKYLESQYREHLVLEVLLLAADVVSFTSILALCL